MKQEIYKNKWFKAWKFNSKTITFLGIIEFKYQKKTKRKKNPTKINSNSQLNQNGKKINK